MGLEESGVAMARTRTTRKATCTPRTIFQTVNASTPISAASGGCQRRLSFL